MCNALGNGSNTATIGDDNITDTYLKGNVHVDLVTQTQLTGSLTDDTPTDVEIDSVAGSDPATVGAGWQVTIKDSDGSGKLYRIESDGTDWFYTVMIKAL